ncbi:MAG: glycosyltransferase [Planctomycetota bacterium]
MANNEPSVENSTNGEAREPSSGRCHNHHQELYEEEKKRRREAEARVDRLQAEADYYKTLVVLREGEVRYRLGDALVRAARPSMDTLKLPLRLASLLLEGVHRCLARRRHNSEMRKILSADTPVCGHDSDVCAVMKRPFSMVPPGLRRRDDVRMATVSDEFSWWAWKFEAESFTFRPVAWHVALEERSPDLLFVESTWKGIDDSWYFQVRHLGTRGEVGYVIPEMVSWCRQRGIPTVFYNKEDPVNFEVFIDAAKQFDCVFTSDANCMADYRKRLGHDRIFSLPFAAQPRIHNPIVTGEARAGSICFAGTWYQGRHQRRQEAAASILKPALDYGLDIYDRMADSRRQGYQWPEEYRSAVRGALPYARMLAAYKQYKVFLNVNSVQSSPTMFARRVFELLACGTPVISSYSEGIEELLGTDIVLMSDSEKTTRELLERVLGDDGYRERLALRGQRKVLSEHTYTHRLQSILDVAGVRSPAPERPVLTMIAAISNSDDMVGAWANFSRQTYEYKRLVLCAADASAVAGVDRLTGETDSVRVIAAGAATVSWGRMLQDAVEACGEGFVLAMNPTNYYGAPYLTDYANAILFVREPAIGKATFYQVDIQDTNTDAEPAIINSGSEYRFVGEVNPWTLCVARAKVIETGDSLGCAGTPDEWWENLGRLCDRVYSADRFNYVQPNTNSVGEEPRSQRLACGDTATTPQSRLATGDLKATASTAV